MKSNLLTKDTIAGAVAREIERVQFFNCKQIEGIAYKAAFERMGSSAFKHIEAYHLDDYLIRTNILSGKFVQCLACGKLFHNKYQVVWGNCCPNCGVAL